MRVANIFDNTEQSTLSKMYAFLVYRRVNVLESEHIHFLVENSWGLEWGREGYGRIRVTGQYNMHFGEYILTMIN